VAVWQHLLMTLDAPAGPWCQSLVVPRPVAEAGRTRLMSAGWDGRSPLLILHPGAGSAGKRWPVEGFVGVIAALRAGRRVTILMIEGPADRDAVSALQSRLDRQVLRGLTLPELAGALSHATAYLGNDSGPSHLAAAVGTAAVILFTAANQAWRPWSAAAWPITVTTTRLVPGDVARVRDRLAASMG
jgi:ADP-heptose:LPS heptosyltransferase